MSETDLRASIIEAVNGSGLAHVWHAQSGKVRVRGAYMQLAPKGTPDLIGYGLRGPLTGRFVAFEVKVPGGKTDKARAEAQNAVRNHVNAHGGHAWIVEGAHDALALLRTFIRTDLPNCRASDITSSARTY